MTQQIQEYYPKDCVFRNENQRLLSEDEKKLISTIKDRASKLYSSFNFHFQNNEDSKRELSLAKTKLEEAVMWAVKGITK